MQILHTLYSGELIPLYIKCFETFRRYNKAARIILYSDFGSAERERLAPFDIEFRDISAEEFKRAGPCYQIQKVRELELADGDEVILCDLDLFFKRDPFAIFRKRFLFRRPFDVFYTSRHYKYHFTVNSGVFGFRVNDAGMRFVNFYIDQTLRPTWPAFLAHRQRFNNTDNWFLDQDFLCAVHENRKVLPPELDKVNVYDAGPGMNYCPDYSLFNDWAIEEVYRGLHKRWISVIHLKAKLKTLISVEDLDI